jgi:predicted CoA-binding protein
MSLVSNILRNNHTFAVVGVSQDPARYGHEIFEALLAKGYDVYPINPKYEVVDGQPCYPSLEALPEKPDVAVAVVPPAVTEKVVETCARQSEKAVDTCEAHGIQEVHDVCLVFALRSLKE